MSYIGKFEEGIVRFSREDKVDGVVCGHIHSPAIHDFDGVTYYNSGDWVESMSALLEHDDGRIELLKDYVAAPASGGTSGELIPAAQAAAGK